MGKGFAEVQGLYPDVSRRGLVADGYGLASGAQDVGDVVVQRLGVDDEIGGTGSGNRSSGVASRRALIDFSAVMMETYTPA